MKFWAVVALAIVISVGIEIASGPSARQRMRSSGAASCAGERCRDRRRYGRLFIHNDKQVGLE
jgi:hypothetical protein